MTNFENQQKRIAFLALHRDLLGHVKQQIGIDVKGHEELIEVVYAVVESLFAKYPLNEEANAPAPITKENGEEMPL